MRTLRRLSLVLLTFGLVPSMTASAQEPGRLPDKKKRPPVEKKKASNIPDLQLNLPAFGEIPKGESLVAPAPERDLTTPQVTSIAAEYKVLAVTHAKSFKGGIGGSKPVGAALKEIALSGNPPESERFTTVVRVHSKQRVSAPIEINIIGPRGNTFMSGRGEVSFRGIKRDEVDYTIIWDPTASADSGTYDVQVKIAGRSMGAWPLTFTVQ